MDYLKKHLQVSITKTNVNLVDELIRICNNFGCQPAHSMIELRQQQRQKSKSGTLFEIFSRQYMVHVYGLKTCWMLKDVPKEVAETLGIGKRDMGIDLIGLDETGRYYAIQCKLRKRYSNRRMGISWKELSTFYALALKTGPYHKHVVITTADYARHVGRKTKKDETITYNRLCKLTTFDWLAMCKISSDSGISTGTRLSREEMRQRRLQYYDSFFG